MKKEKISTRRLDLLPDINSLKETIQKIACFELIYLNGGNINFDSKYNLKTEAMTWENGSGSFLKIFFNNEGAIIIGFNHESGMSRWANRSMKIWPGVIDNVPKEFEFAFKTRFEFECLPDAITYCIWRNYKDSKWNIGNIIFPEIDEDTQAYGPDGSEEILSCFDGNHVTYLEWSSQYNGEVFTED
jgi:hypothetical protein